MTVDNLAQLRVHYVDGGVEGVAASRASGETIPHTLFTSST